MHCLQSVRVTLLSVVPKITLSKSLSIVTGSEPAELHLECLHFILQQMWQDNKS